MVRGVGMRSAESHQSLVRSPKSLNGGQFPLDFELKETLPALFCSFCTFMFMTSVIDVLLLLIVGYGKSMMGHQARTALHVVGGRCVRPRGQ